MNKSDQFISSYESAVQFKIHEGELVWSRFSGFMVAHTIFFLLIGQIIIERDLPINRNMSLLLISIVGLILSFLWLLSTIRGFESVEFWSDASIELSNKQINNPMAEVFKKGREYFKLNHGVYFDIGTGRKKYIQRSIVSQLIRINTRWISYLTIFIIFLCYLLIIVGLLMGLI